MAKTTQSKMEHICKGFNHLSAKAAAIGIMGSQATRRNPSTRASSLQAKQMEVRVLHATVDRW